MGSNRVKNQKPLTNDRLKISLNTKKRRKAMNLPKIFVNSVPKSGTHLLLQIMLGIPGTKEGTGILMHNHQDITKMQPGEVSKGHLHYTKEMAELLNRENIRRFFIYRDPRDVVISMVYYTSNMDKSTFLFKYFNHFPKSFDQRVMTVIQGIKNIDPSIAKTYLHGHSEYPDICEFFNRFINWKDDPNTLTVKYEDLINPQLRRKNLLKIADFLWEDIKGLGLEKEKIAEMMEQNINPAKSRTFREGKSGGWKNHFNEHHKQAFKNTAGELLIKLGYENNCNW